MQNKMFQIAEQDLQSLESILPLIYEEATDLKILNQRRDLQDSFIMVKEILSKVRWNYAPHTDIQEIE